MSFGLPVPVASDHRPVESSEGGVRAPSLRRHASRKGIIVYSKLLVPLDGSDLAEAVLPYVVELVGKFGSEVTLLQVVDSFERVVAEAMPAAVEPAAGAAVVGVEVAEEQVRAQQDHAQGYLSETAATLQAQGISSRFEIVEGGAAESIVRYANEHGIDLIAMSTHGRSGLGRLFFGSVSEDVLRAATCPVLLIRSQEHHKRGD